MPGGKGLNIAYEAVDRHAEGPLAHKTAIRWLGKDDSVLDFTYEALGVEIPAKDYGNLVTVDDMVEYLMARLA